MDEEVAVGDFVVRQRKLKKEEALTRAYDAVIAGLSWESRGPAALARLSGLETQLTLFKFRSRSDETEVAKASQLEEFRALLPQLVVKELDSSTETVSRAKM